MPAEMLVWSWACLSVAICLLSSGTSVFGYSSKAFRAELEPCAFVGPSCGLTEAVSVADAQLSS
eukprot:6945636-Prorocentrum_lima.AAC.1